MRDLLSASDNADLVEGTNFGTKTSVDAENSSINKCGKWKKVEYLTGCFPY
jgi:hypothetical protein